MKESGLAPDALLNALKYHFGHDSFRPHQQDAVTATLAGRDTLIVLPTGACASAREGVCVCVACRSLACRQQHARQVSAEQADVQQHAAVPCCATLWRCTVLCRAVPRRAVRLC
jgi:hypothetical protein